MSGESNINCWHEHNIFTSVVVEKELFVIQKAHCIICTLEDPNVE